MEVVLYMAQSLNGKIARQDNSEDFLSPGNWSKFVELAEEAGCFAVGRKTYQEVSRWDNHTFNDVEADRIVVSRDHDLEFEGNYFQARSPEKALEIASREGNEKLILTGGASLNSSFMAEESIDRVKINIEPFLLGRGIEVFADSSFEAELDLNAVKKLEEDIVQLSYECVY